mmetsp:Transcript_25361/g.84749  ORF Transcript_25361/g.84749 Transcript_25361/m.84749 type:complete len:200 (-) Transcript_25361:244-843(-)
MENQTRTMFAAIQLASTERQGTSAYERRSYFSDEPEGLNLSGTLLYSESSARVTWLSSASAPSEGNGKARMDAKQSTADTIEEDVVLTEKNSEGADEDLKDLMGMFPLATDVMEIVGSGGLNSYGSLPARVHHSSRPSSFVEAQGGAGQQSRAAVAAAAAAPAPTMHAKWPHCLSWCASSTKQALRKQESPRKVIKVSL